ncbi:MAG: L,D-transpeptidase family protein [Candidatus Eisenbacteria bacterium]|uniref:L,D-transpeptidase family protein n=1 Tax=Eiseniibacteriota bacterium TaxID=2212470 RepID=A0A948W7T8_UNCEI|nr:L,D-transpeptidase family protein [Candidatus Eisenbacteria bacterium]MBU1949322.1 L,D-transpeptidase family protein [Candidatus Eisenbacteria bacterium]MBU2692949.1 L,D-transpeptidase family protein [Candidatus Eisenbacteria bacterium]
MAGRSFKDEQICFPRVRVAYQEKLGVIKTFFDQQKASFPPTGIYMRVIKAEGLLELWTQSEPNDPYLKVREYEICAHSGGLGPKRREGDMQVPEGFYKINCFNPASRFHLALGLDYPNLSDGFFSDQNSPGGDIFIHGSCLSIGCLAMTDSYIKELYIAAVEARNMGQGQIPVHIFPAHMDSSGMEWLQQALLSGSGPYAAMVQEPGGEDQRSELLRFWRNLQEGYESFVRTGMPPVVAIDSEGAYTFTVPAAEEEPQGISY